MATVLAPTEKFTVNQFHWLAEQGVLENDRRIELLNGEVLPVCPVGPSHRRTLRALVSMIDINSPNYLVDPQAGIVLSETSEVYPDYVLLKRSSDNYRRKTPAASDVLLAVEVSDKSLRFDLGEKRLAYAVAGIAEYWLIDVNAKVLHRFLEPKSGVYTRHETIDSGVISPAAVPSVRVAVAELF